MSEQLEIFGYRPRSGNRAVEFRLQCAIARTIRQFIRPQWRAVHLPFGEKRDPATAGRLKAMGVERGWPDWLCVRARTRDLGGAVCFLELKRHGGVRSAEQVAIGNHVMAAGCGYCVADSYDEAIGALIDWGVLPATIHVQ